MKNFRSSYLQKVGLNRESVDTNKVLDQILGEPVIDRMKVRKFSLQFHVPSTHRVEVWKLILGISSLRPEAAEFVAYQRLEQYRLLWHSLHVMRKSRDFGSGQSPPRGVARIRAGNPKTKDLLKMFLLEEGCLALDDEHQVQNPIYWPFLAIAVHLLAICKNGAEPGEESGSLIGQFMCEDSWVSDAYWLTKEFYRFLIGLEVDEAGEFQPIGEKRRGGVCKRQPVRGCNFHGAAWQQRQKVFEALVTDTKKQLCEQDQELWQHIGNSGLWSAIPLQRWFQCAFAEVFCSETIPKLWNNVIGGSIYAMAFVAVELVMSIRAYLIELASKKDYSSEILAGGITGYCNGLSVDTQSTVIYRGLARWCDEGSVMMPKPVGLSGNHLDVG